jgi:phosphomannomutase/phosphoglucomutase
VKCSQSLPDAVERAGGKPLMWKTGHSLIKDKMRETHAPIAGEMSGHMFFSEGFYGHDDALYGTARLLRILADSGQTVAQALADVPELVTTPEIRIDVPEELKFGLVSRAVEHFRAKHDVIDVDGVRVLFGDGWGLIRASNTQPVIVARYEAATAERLAAIRGEMEGWLRAQGVRI